MQRTLIFLLTLFLTVTGYGNNKVEKIQQAIHTNNANWTAGENPISKLSKAEFRQLLGTYNDDIPIDGEAKLIELPMQDTIPANFDWRDNDGNWVTPVKSQGACGSCWDFSAVGQIEAWWKIHYDYPDSNIDLSEQYILSCGSEAGSCDGGWPYAALEFVKNNPLPHEKYMPYETDDSVPCSNIAEGWESSAVTIPGWGYITLEEAQVINIKNALLHHPVSASYDVYEDFAYYNGGVYEHSWGEYEGGHAILIVGWEDDTQSWICKNSWGRNWGEQGYFRIKWGNCRIGRNIPIIYDEITSDVSLSFSTDTVHEELAAATAASQAITITNNSAGPVEIYTTDSQDPVIFHRSSYNAYEGRSWWCGIKTSGGYENHWLQYLETPNIDLSSTTDPELTFKAKWSVEPSDGAQSPYDGWDGWNVWLSTDNGQSYRVIEPDYPAYTNSALWAFGHPEQGWNMGTSVKGWTGYSDHWEDVKFDLTEYAGQSVNIRFGFASDMGYSSPDDATLEGLFIDNIFIRDNETIIFADSAGSNTAMKRSGMGDLPNNWLDLFYSSNKLNPAESMDLALNFKAPLSAGNYTGRINFLANNDNAPLPTIPVNLTVTPAESDLAVEGFIRPGQKINTLLKHPIGVNLVNNGSSMFIDIEITLTEPSTNATETKVIEQLQPGEIRRVWFEAQALAKTESTNLIVSHNIEDDIEQNNQDTLTVGVNDFNDNFENYGDYWQLGNGVNFSTANPYEGIYHLKIQKDTASQQLLTLKQPLKISNNTIDITFYAKNSAYQLTSTIFIDYSFDKTVWTPADSVTINRTAYELQTASIIPDWLNSEKEVYIRLRSHLTSENQLRLDNLSLSPVQITAIEQDQHTPETLSLSQNYPNPFNPETTISYGLPKSTRVQLAIYDLNGKLVKKLVDKQQSSGTYTLSWHAENLASGLYFYRLTTESQVFNRKMMLMK
ncbi:MAG: C1 family peptidase [Fidelibacterota bacterium]